MKLISRALTIFGLILFLGSTTQSARDYQGTYVLIGVIFLALAYLAYQHKPGYKPREVTSQDHERLKGMFDTVRDAALQEKLQIKQEHLSEGTFMVWVRKHNRAVLVQNGQLGVSGYPSRPGAFQPGQIDYDEMYEVERTLNEYIKRIQK
jgi:hypothetical protein